jgi:hypothetical protein
VGSDIGSAKRGTLSIGFSSKKVTAIGGCSNPTRVVRVADISLKLMGHSLFLAIRT